MRDHATAIGWSKNPERRVEHVEGAERASRVGVEPVQAKRDRGLRGRHRPRLPGKPDAPRRKASASSTRADGASRSAMRANAVVWAYDRRSTSTWEGLP